MAKRRRFTGEFKAKVALEALRGECPIQAEEDQKTAWEAVFPTKAARYGVHPNQVSTWKKQAVDGLGTVFSDNAEKAERDHEAAVRDLHAKIGELTVERDFLVRGLKR
jgi:transposase